MAKIIIISQIHIIILHVFQQRHNFPNIERDFDAEKVWLKCKGCINQMQQGVGFSSFLMIFLTNKSKKTA